jgi:glycosyltransferase involved in cell wall biosynthesis
MAMLDPRTPAILDIIGTGPEERALRDLTRSLGVEPRVNFRGWLEPEEIQAYLRNECHCLVHPVIRLEPYGVVIIEALANAVPVIGTNECGAVVDRVEEGKNGFTVQTPVKPKALAERMSLLVADRELLSRMSSEARRSAEEWPVERGVEIIASMVGCAT